MGERPQLVARFPDTAFQLVFSKSAQAIFTSHSPYILEEFKPSEVLVINRKEGELTSVPAEYPPAVKPKKYKDELRRRFCENKAGAISNENPGNSRM